MVVVVVVVVVVRPMMLLLLGWRFTERLIPFCNSQKNRSRAPSPRSPHQDYSRQFITTSAEVTPNGGLVRESPPKMALNQVKDL